MDGPRRYELTDCDREPIHALGYVQPFGALIAANSDWTLAYHSANAAEMLGLAEPMDDGYGQSYAIAPGTNLEGVLTSRALKRIEASVTELDSYNPVERIMGLELVNGRRFDCAVHRLGDLTMIDIEPEPSESESNGALDLLRPVASRLEATHDIVQICEIGAKNLKRILGYDRVMVYRFHGDGTGEVIAEQREPEQESYLGLRYPRTDIPEQARELYLRNRFRIIADVDAEPVPVLPKARFDEAPLDLSQSMLRAISPIHIQYLKNMGVNASLSVSIVHQGRLWGLFACHHSSAKPLPLATRTTAELYSQMFSIALDRALLTAGDQIRRDGIRLHDLIMTRLARGSSLIESLSVLDELLGQTIKHDGMSVFADGVYRSRGSAPTRQEFEKLLPAFNASSPGKIIAQEALSTHISAAKAFGDRAAGALVLPISRNPRDYLVLWRRELPQKVVWAGNPDKAINRTPDEKESLTPRSSFAAWEQNVTDHSERWNEADLQIAESLRTTLIEVVLKLTDEAERVRRRAQEQQSLLIAELNHRVRNILNLIRSLIDQSRHEALDVEQFVDIVGGRIAALASAHENITQENWAPAPISKLIEAEAKAYLNEKRDRVRLRGDDVMITPQAYTVLALVLHEMVTNSAKYGSLCDRRGELEIALERTPEGDLMIDWREIGGPPVKEPTRRGFGSTIIERSIPYELNGYTKVDFRPEGLEAKFRIPADYIREGSVVDGAQAKALELAERQAYAGDAALRPKRLLLVEDSMIIALDTAEILRQLGVDTVTTCSSASAALEAIQQTEPDFAIVDFNLGAETSERVIQDLRQRGISFLLATGYGDVEQQADVLGATGLLRKPYGQSELKKAVPGLSGGAPSVH